MSDSLKQRVLAAAAQRPAPTRAAFRRRGVVVYGVAVLGMLAIFGASGGVGCSAGRPAAVTWGIAGAASLLALVATLAFVSGRSMLGRSLAVLAGIAVLVPLLTVPLLASFSGLYVEPFARFGWRCMGLTISMGGLLLGALLWRRRQTLADRAAPTGAALGAIGGAWGGTLVDLWCPLSNLPHALVGHALPMAMLAVLGAVLGAWVLPVRARG